MTLLLLPAPKPVLLLPAFAASLLRKPTPPLAALTAGEEILLTLYTQRLAISDGLKFDEDGDRWMPIGEHARQEADMLVIYGYLEKHPDKRRKMWYGLTENGLLRAKMALNAFAGDDHQMPLAVSAAQARLNIHAEKQGDTMLVLRWKRQDSLRRLARDMGSFGYVLYHEEGRISNNEQAFYNLFTREIVLFTSRIGDWQWTLRRSGYFKPEFAAEVAAQLQTVNAAF